MTRNSPEFLFYSRFFSVFFSFFLFCNIIYQIQPHPHATIWSEITTKQYNEIATKRQLYRNVWSVFGQFFFVRSIFRSDLHFMFWSIFFLSLSQQSTRRNCSDRHILGATQVRTNCILFGVVRGMISVFEKIRDNKIVQVVFVQNLFFLRIWFNLSIFVFYTFL